MIVIGCPYNSLKGIKTDLVSGGKDVVDVSEIVSIDSEGFHTNSNYFKFACVSKSYIRYPYDLIPPATKSFELREETEFLKTIALALNNVAVNNFFNAHFLRNRYYSLISLCQLGAKVAKFIITKDGLKTFNPPFLIQKAIGNCFVSDVDGQLDGCFELAEDDGDVAVILPAQRVSRLEIANYNRKFGAGFFQEQVFGKEYRLFYIAGSLCIYKRTHLQSRVDQSAGNLVKTQHPALTERVKKIFGSFAEHFGLEYFCADVIETDDGEVYILDLNPYGSMPSTMEKGTPKYLLSQLLSR